MKIFDSLLGRKFSAKCKESIKFIEARIHLKRKKKQAVIKFLRKDVADLIASGHDENAFRRMDELIFEINQISCYDMIEHFCESILSQLPCLQKQRECPQEEMEAVATLIYAAARFSDLLELCNLRSVFMTRYGSAMESSVNPEFAEKTSIKSFSKDRKLKMMQEIAQEFYVDWDSKFFGQKKPNPSVQEPPKKEVPIWNEKAAVLDVAPPNGITKKQDSVLTVYTEPPLIGNVVKDARLDAKDIHMIPSTNGIFPVNPIKKTKITSADEPENVKPCKERDRTIPPHIKPRSTRKGLSNTEHWHDNMYDRSPSPQGVADFDGDRHAKPNVKSKNNVAPPDVRPKEYKNNGACAGKCQGLELLSDPFAPEKHAGGLVKSDDDRTPVKIVPPPYVRSNVIHAEGKKRENGPVKQNDTPSINRNPPYVKPNGSKAGDSRSPPDNGIKEDNLVDDRRPLPRSVRRNHHRPRAATAMNGSAVDVEKPTEQIPEARRHGPRPAHEDGYDEEDMIMDKLLMHYSRKGMPCQVLKTKVPPHVDHGIEKKHQTDGNRTHPERTVESLNPPPTRAVSLPAEPISPTERAAPPRAATMQPDVMISARGGGRVHPKLPDYDELAAHFTALKRG